MFAVFGKIKKVEYARSFNKLGRKIKNEEVLFRSNSRCYQISGDFSSEKIAMEFVGLCANKKDIIRPVYIASLRPILGKDNNEKIDKRTKKPLMRYVKFKDVTE